MLNRSKCPIMKVSDHPDFPEHKTYERIVFEINNDGSCSAICQKDEENFHKGIDFCYLSVLPYKHCREIEKNKNNEHGNNSELKPKDAIFLKEIADHISNNSPDNSAFFLFTTLPGQTQLGRYVSNMRRRDALVCMMDFIYKNIEKDVWGKHFE